MAVKSNGSEKKQLYSIRLRPSVYKAIVEVHKGFTKFVDKSVKSDKKLQKRIKDGKEKLNKAIQKPGM